MEFDDLPPGWGFAPKKVESVGPEMPEKRSGPGRRTAIFKPGVKFGRLTVIRHLNQNEVKVRSRSRKHLCRCDCGTLHEVRTRNLVSGSVKSCGCLHREAASKNISGYLEKRRAEKIA